MAESGRFACLQAAVANVAVFAACGAQCPRDDRDRRHDALVAEAGACIRHACGGDEALARDLVHGVVPNDPDRRAALKVAQRVLLVELAARGLIPIPNRADAWFCEQVDARRDAIRRVNDLGRL